MLLIDQSCRGVQFRLGILHTAARSCNTSKVSATFHLVNVCNVLRHNFDSNHDRSRGTLLLQLFSLLCYRYVHGALKHGGTDHSVYVPSQGFFSGIDVFGSGDL